MTKEKTLKALEYKKQTLIQKKDVWELSLHRECRVSGFSWLVSFLLSV